MPHEEHVRQGWLQIRHTAQSEGVEGAGRQKRVKHQRVGAWLYSPARGWHDMDQNPGYTQLFTSHIFTLRFGRSSFSASPSSYPAFAISFSFGACCLRRIPGKERREWVTKLVFPPTFIHQRIRGLERNPSVTLCPWSICLGLDDCESIGQTDIPAAKRMHEWVKRRFNKRIPSSIYLRSQVLVGPLDAMLLRLGVWLADDGITTCC